MPYVTNAGLSRALLAVGSTTVSDILDEAGYPGQVLASHLIANVGSQPFCGPAMCARGVKRTVTQTPIPAGVFPPHYEITNFPVVEHVLVLATQGFRDGALVGGRIARRLKENGCLGLLTDGYVRDSKELAEIGLPISAHGFTPINGSKRWALKDIGIPVTLPAHIGGSVTIKPEDFILIDEDGGIVVPKEILQEVVSMSEEFLLKEADIIKREQAREGTGSLQKELYSHIRWLNDA